MFKEVYPPDKDPALLVQLQIWYMRIVAGAIMVFALIGFVAQAISLSQSRSTPEQILQNSALQIAVLLVGIIVIILLNRKQVRVAANFLVVALTIASLFLLWLGIARNNIPSLFSGAFLITGVTAIISTATLARTWLYAISTFLILMGGILTNLYYQLTLPEPSVIARETLFNVSINMSLVIISVATRFFISAAIIATRESRRAADLLNASSDVGQIIAKELNLSTLLDRAVELIRDRFAFYHVQIFLIDEAREFARLVASTGETGQQLLARQHRLRVGSRSVIGRATQVGAPIMVGDTESDTIHARNELLPHTRSELAIPLFDGDTNIGALDVQSTRRNAFSANDIQALQVMANQLATAIRNARLFEAQSASVKENKRLLLEAESNLREIQRLNRQMTKDAWQQYLEHPDRTSAVMLDGTTLSNDAPWSEKMLEATQKRRAISQLEGNTYIVAVPIVLRGEVLGAIEIETTAETAHQDIIEMVQSVAQRLAISLDNARLFEESQEATAQEQRINNIGLRYQAAANIDELLQITLLELSDSLGATSGSIRIGSLRDKDRHHHSNGGTS